MTEDNKELGERMQRLEQRVDEIARGQNTMASNLEEIRAALLGNVLDGSPGILGRVRERERTAENHDLRIVRLETERKYYVEKKDFEELEASVKANTEWRQRVMWMIAGAAAAGAITGGGIVAAVMQALGG